MGKEDVPPPQDGKDEKKPSGEHEKDQSTKDQRKNGGKKGVNIL
jgi:hypothetical protein